MEGLVIIVAILAVWYWLGHVSLTQIIQKDSGDSNATVTVKEVIICMVLSLVAVHAVEEHIIKSKN